MSLWQVKLFPAFNICEDSVSHVINMINSLKSGNQVDKGNNAGIGKSLSMEDILGFKDIKGTLDIRENLRRKILGT